MGDMPVWTGGRGQPVASVVSLRRQSAEHLRLLAAIAAVLGDVAPDWKSSDAAPSDEGRLVLAGVVEEDEDAHTRRVGWVEEAMERTSTGHEHRITLNAAGGGIGHQRVGLYHYNPYFGTDVHLIRFFGDALVVLYREKHRNYIRSTTLPPTRTRMARVGDSFVVHDDLLIHVGSDDLVHHLIMPGLEPQVPLPLPPKPDYSRRTRLTVEREADETSVRCTDLLAGGEPGARRWSDGKVMRLRLPSAAQRGLPVDRRGVWARLRSLLDDPLAPLDGADVLIATLGGPFWGATDHRAIAAWFAVVYHCGLGADTATDRAEQATQWLAFLDRLANARPEPQGWAPGWDTVEGAAQLALARIQFRASGLATACRSGNVPHYPFRDARSKEEAADRMRLGELPEGFARAWERIPAEAFAPAAS